MRLLFTTLLSLVLAAQSYPPPFPRPGAAKLLDNDRVQVWNVAWPKGQPTPLHRHPYDMTGLYFSPGDRMITAVDGSKRPVTTKAGDIVWQLKGITHIEEGTSDEPLRAVMIELKSDAPSADMPLGADPAPIFPRDGATRLLDNARVTVWDYSPGQAARQPHRHAHDAVVVWLDGQSPHALYTPRGAVHVEPIGVAPRATIFELK